MSGLLPIVVISLLSCLLVVYFLWRFHFFFRDPDRNIPTGNNVVSPADGTVVYVKEFTGGEVPLAVKLGRSILLDELFGLPITRRGYLLFGIFMHPTSVHVNRAPISGDIVKIKFTKGKNKPMTLTWWRAVLGMKPYEKFATHIVSNDRNTIIVGGSDFEVAITQIADIYVSKIECWAKQGDSVKKGDRVGRIIFGSQVDILVPLSAGVVPVVKTGDKVLAGESILATC